MDTLIELWRHLKCSSCNELERKSSICFEPVKGNTPIPFIIIKPKDARRSDDEDESSEKEEIQEDILKRISIEINIPKDKCFSCQETEYLIDLECGHSVCDPCLSNLLESECSNTKPQILKCICGDTIKSRLFQNITLEETLLYYLKELNMFRLKNFQENDCVVCGFSHSKECSCSEFYNNNKTIKKCDKCNNTKEEFSLPCDHKYCSKCLRTTVRSTFEKDPFSNVFCVLCGGKNTAIPLWILQGCFGRPSNFIRAKQAYIESNILSPRQECQICKETASISKFVTLDCNHRFCKNCVSLYIENKINTSQVRDDELGCPICGREIESHIIKDCVKEPLFNTYLDLTLKKLRPRSDSSKMKWCQICNFGYFTENHACEVCPNCNNSLAKFNSQSFVQPTQPKQKAIEDLPNDIIICPGCSNGFQKERGCNFVKCLWPTCEIYFCALCKSDLRQSQHYKHFTRSGPFGKTCNKLDGLGV